MPIERVLADYTARADEYTALLGSIDATASEDRTLISTWAQAVDGLIVDVGCGPGHWTNYLRMKGAAVVGVDPVDAFVQGARRSYPDADYQLGRAEHLDATDASVGGILAWYSLIHTEPQHIDAALQEFARVIRPGGRLLLGFFEGVDVAPFDHSVTTAYAWPIPVLIEHVQGAGFEVTGTQARTDPGSRPHGAIVALRAST